MCSIFKVVVPRLKALYYSKQFFVVRIILYFQASKLLTIISNQVLVELISLPKRLQKYTAIGIIGSVSNYYQGQIRVKVVKQRSLYKRSTQFIKCLLSVVRPGLRLIPFSRPFFILLFFLLLPIQCWVAMRPCKIYIQGVYSI